MSDLVCVMDSDGQHGWIKASGYPSESRIKKQIVVYLEGGVDSFKHKMHIYRDVIKWFGKKFCKPNRRVAFPNC